jgi:hypothetical protein
MHMDQLKIIHATYKRRPTFPCGQKKTMSNPPAYHSQPLASPSPPLSPYQGSVADKSFAAQGQGQRPQQAYQPGPAPPVENQPRPPPGQHGPPPPGQHGPPPPGQYGPPPPGQHGAPPAPYGAPMMGQGMPYMMPSILSPEQLKGIDYPCMVKCPNCQLLGMTNVKKETNTLVFVLYIVFLIAGIIFFPLLIPAIILAFYTKSQIHECPKCSHHIFVENKSCG